MSHHPATPHSRPVVWHRTSRAEFPYEADVDGARWQIRINDFPAEPMYTLLINGQKFSDYDDWPNAWKKPG